MGTSPDVGGTRGLGRPQVPDVNEQQQTAQVQVAKAGLGMVPNTIEVPFTQLGAQVWKYQANGNKPLLESNVFSGISRPEQKRADPQEEEAFQQLMNELPLQLSMELREETKKPWALREPSFIVLELLLKFVAKARTWLESATNVSSSQHSQNSAKIQAYPQATLRGWIALTSEVIHTLQSTPSLLEKTSVGYIKMNMEELLKIKRYLQAALNEKEEKREKIYTKLIDQIFTLKLQIEMRKVVGIFHITKSLLDAILPLLVALSRKTGSASWETLILQTPALFAGKATEKVFNALAKSNPDATFEEIFLIPRVTALSTTLFAALIFTASGTRRLQERGDPRLEHFNVLTLALRLASCLIAHSDVIKIVASHLLKRAGLSDEATKNSSAIIALLSYQGPLLSFSNEEDRRDAESFMRGMEKKISSVLEEVKEFLGANDPEVSTAVRQANMAIKKQNVAGYFEALQRALNPLHIRLSTLQDEAAQWLQLILVWLKTMYEIGKQTNFTSVVSQIA